MAHLNICSLVNKWENFKANFMNKNLQVLGISETWLNANLPSEMFDLSNNYNFYRNERSWADVNFCISNMLHRHGYQCLYIC